MKVLNKENIKKICQIFNLSCSFEEFIVKIDLSLPKLHEIDIDWLYTRWCKDFIEFLPKCIFCNNVFSFKKAFKYKKSNTFILPYMFKKTYGKNHTIHLEMQTVLSPNGNIIKSHASYTVAVDLYDDLMATHGIDVNKELFNTMIYECMKECEIKYGC